MPAPSVTKNHAHKNRKVREKLGALTCSSKSGTHSISHVPLVNTLQVSSNCSPVNHRSFSHYIVHRHKIGTKDLLNDTVYGIVFDDMGKVRRGGYIFEFWVGDHPPRHVHILKDRRLIAKVELDKHLTLMEGKINRRIRTILKTLVKEGLIK